MSVDYAKLSWKNFSHHQRFVKFVEIRKLICMECGGNGGWKEVILDDGTGPWEECGWCEGTGYMTPKGRGFWLMLKRLEKKGKL